MNIQKKVISDLTLCYCLAPLTYKGEPCFLVASEKEYPCLLFDRFGEQIDEIWKEPGGTMSAVALPGTEGAFLAIHRFYSPNNCREAEIVLCRYNGTSWDVKTIAELPYIHRFDIIRGGDSNYFIGCCLKSNYEYKDDWRFPGMVFACRLPDDMLNLPENYSLPLALIKDGMLKNHGYCRDLCGGIESGIVTCEEGIFRFTPPQTAEETWSIRQLTAEAASDAVLVDLDGDGEKEIVALCPFHGDTLKVYALREGRYVKVYEYEEKIEFAHAICHANIHGKNVAFIGYRKGNRELLSLSYTDGAYCIETIDSDVGPANVMYMNVDGRNVLVSANREISQVAYYTIE